MITTGLNMKQRDEVRAQGIPLPPGCNKLHSVSYQPRTFFNGSQFECPVCGGQTTYPPHVIGKYMAVKGRVDFLKSIAYKEA